MFTDPVKNLKTLGLREDNIVADLGAGTGYYAVALGKILQRGKVYAIEIQQDFLTKIKHKVHDAGLKNVECFWGNVEKLGGTKIKDGIADVAIAASVLFQVEDRDTFILETKRILKPNGRVLLVDWSEASFIPGIKVIPKIKALDMFKKHGFVLDREIDAGEHHYGMILRKQ